MQQSVTSTGFTIGLDFQYNLSTYTAEDLSTLLTLEISGGKTANFTVTAVRGTTIFIKVTPTMNIRNVTATVKLTD